MPAVLRSATVPAEAPPDLALEPKQTEALMRGLPQATAQVPKATEALPEGSPPAASQDSKPFDGWLSEEPRAPTQELKTPDALLTDMHSMVCKLYTIQTSTSAAAQTELPSLRGDSAELLNSLQVTVMEQGRLFVKIAGMLAEELKSTRVALQQYVDDGFTRLARMQEEGARDSLDVLQAERRDDADAKKSLELENSLTDLLKDIKNQVGKNIEDIKSHVCKHIDGVFDRLAKSNHSSSGPVIAAPIKSAHFEASKFALEKSRSIAHKAIPLDLDSKDIILKSHLIDGALSSVFKHQDASDLRKRNYYVENCYRDIGFSQAVARSEIFQQTILFLVFLNAVYIGIDADWNTAVSLYSAHFFFIAAENFFCIVFACELIVRFCAFANKVDFFKDGWCRFDSVMVGLMIGEVWIFSVVIHFLDMEASGFPVQPFRLLKLLRLTRVSRLGKDFPELVTLTKSMFAGFRAVMSTLAFVVVLTYAFATVLQTLMSSSKEFNRDHYPRDFENIPRCMWTLLLDGTLLMDTGELLSSMLFSGNINSIAACFCFMLFILLSAVTLMNMLIGVLCEVVSEVAKRERDDKDTLAVKDAILERLLIYDDGAGVISRDELFHVMRDPVSARVLEKLNIDRLFLGQLHAASFPDAESRIEVKKAMELMLLCRGDLPVTVQHLAYSHASVITLLNDVLDCFTQQFTR